MSHSSLLPSDQPPAQRRDPLPGFARERLPVPLTSFIGRQRELAHACSMLQRPDLRLLTVTGPGGVGKTRFVLRLASDVAPEFTAGVAFVPLATVSDPRLVLSAIAERLGLPERGDRTAADRLASAIGDRELLLILDNIEQVRAAGPELARLLSECQSLKLLVTSRAALHVTGEQEVQLPPLDTGSEQSEVAGEPEAVQLFVQRARAVAPDFSLTAENCAVVRDICRRLDGLPLAIELAAARCRLLTPETLLPRLNDRLALLTGGPADSPERHQTLRAAIAWSYDLLSAVEQQALSQLSVFIGGCSIEAAEAVIALDDDAPPIFDVVTSLAHNSLLRRSIQPDGTPRLVILESIREFALEQLERRGEAYAARLRHAEWCWDLVDRHWTRFLVPGQKESVAIYARDLDNLRAAMAWSIDQPELTLGEEMAGSLAHFWYVQGNWSEGLDWMERASSRGKALDLITRLRLLVGAAFVHSVRRDFPRAMELANQSVQLLPADTSSIDHDLLGRIFSVRGGVAVDLGDLVLAEHDLELALRHFRRAGTGSAGIAALALAITARLAFRRGDLDRAETLFAESLELQRQLGNQSGSAWPLNGLARISVRRGDYPRAAELFAECLATRWEQSDQTGSLTTLRGLADVARAARLDEDALRFLAATAALSEATGSTLTGAPRERFERAIDQARRNLDPARRDAAWAAGQAMTFEEAIAAARRLAATLRGSATAPASDLAAERPAGLTPREIEVLRLIAAGRSNPEIADLLSISPRTASTHVTNILAKLDLDSRAAAAAYAARHDLA
jgi:non-specific serine/threonine protein kinase